MGCPPRVVDSNTSPVVDRPKLRHNARITITNHGIRERFALRIIPEYKIGTRHPNANDATPTNKTLTHGIIVISKAYNSPLARP
jgi:hypothetical protein